MYTLIGLTYPDTHKHMHIHPHTHSHQQNHHHNQNNKHVITPESFLGPFFYLSLPPSHPRQPIHLLCVNIDEFAFSGIFYINKIRHGCHIFSLASFTQQNNLEFYSCYWMYLYPFLLNIE